MNHLIDTCVISELVRPRPNRLVIDWFETVPPETLHISVLTLGEIRKGVEKRSSSERTKMLRHWLERDLPDWFGKRILPIDRAVADRWGQLQAETNRSISAVDNLLAATALHHGMNFVTRNIKDFPFSGLKIINPWVARTN